MQVGYHTDATTCMMFLTSMAGNPLCVGLAASAVGVEITWTNWALAAIVPGLIFGAGYVSQGEWWRNGFVICTLNVVIWLTIGMAWWKVIGLY